MKSIVKSLDNTLSKLDIKAYKKTNITILKNNQYKVNYPNARNIRVIRVLRNCLIRQVNKS